MWTLTLAFVKAGQARRGRRLLREYEALVPEGIRRLHFAIAYAARGRREAEGRDQHALDAYRTLVSSDDGNCVICGSYELGQLQDRLGQPDSAIAAFERVAGAHDPGGLR